VLAEPIYHWRIREDDGDRSITQRRTDPRGLADRVRSIELVRGWLLDRPEPVFREHLRAYDHNTLVEELPMFFWTLPDGDAVYRHAYQRHVTRLLSAIGPDRIAALPRFLRLKYRLTVAGRLHTLATVQRLHRAVRNARKRLRG
jgi:CDP-glycerol glycerophosphotransferase